MWLYWSTLFQFYRADRFLLCPVWVGLPIIRDPNNKWFASYEDLPRDTEKYPGSGPVTEMYPVDCTGWIYILNPGTAARLAQVELQGLVL